MCIEKVKKIRTTHVSSNIDCQLHIIWNLVDVSGLPILTDKTKKYTCGADSLIWQPSLAKHQEGDLRKDTAAAASKEELHLI